jgi:hypothetical protein
MAFNESLRDTQQDPEIIARWQLHRARQVKAGKKPLSFALWLQFYMAGKAGGLMSGSDKSAAGKRSAEVRRANAEKRKLQPA